MIKNLLKTLFTLSSHPLGMTLRMMPDFLLKELVSLWGAHPLENEILSKWAALIAQAGLKDIQHPLEVTRQNFYFHGQSFHYQLALDIRQYTQRKYFFENYGQDLGNLMSRNLHEDSIVIDIGAHIGFFSILAAHLCPRGQVYAFEPFMQNYLQLMKNKQINDFHHLNAFPLALSNQTGQILLYENPSNDGGHSVDPGWFGSGINAKSSKIVQMLRFDQWRALQALPPIDFLKVDVEGHEVEVFQGMQETLQQHPPRLIFCEVNQQTLPLVNELVLPWGYQIFRLKGGQLNTFSLPKEWSFDVIYIKNYLSQEPSSPLAVN